MDDIIASHELVRELVENGWLHPFRIAEDGGVHRRRGRAHWETWDEVATVSTGVSP